MHLPRISRCIARARNWIELHFASAALPQGWLPPLWGEKGQNHRGPYPTKQAGVWQQERGQRSHSAVCQSPWGCSQETPTGESTRLAPMPVKDTADYDCPVIMLVSAPVSALSNSIIHQELELCMDAIFMAVNEPVSCLCEDRVNVHSWFELIHCSHAAKRNNWWTSIKQKLGMTPPIKVAQRYYPQCLTCCQKQAAAAKANRRTLVVHKAGPRPWHYAGV